MSCSARVWDNGDTTDCGRPATKLDRCERCYITELRNLREKIAQRELELAPLRARLAQLESA